MKLALVVALLAGTLDPVEVATRHEQAGRPELALHLLDAITQGAGDAAAQAVRERLKGKLGRTATTNATVPVSASPKSKPPVVAAEDPVPLFKAKEYMRAAKLFRAALEGNPQDFSAFSYLTNCYWHEADRLVQDGKQADAAKAYDEGLRVEEMYGGAFAGELSGSTAPEGLAQRVGR